MVQPKTPPLSIRVPPTLLAAIDAMAERRGIKRHAAILLALVQGEAADRGLTPQLLAETAKALASIPSRKPKTGVEVMTRARGVTFKPHPKPTKGKK